MQPAVIDHAVPALSILHRRSAQEGKVLQKGLARVVTAKKEVGGVKSDSALVGTLKNKILRLRHNLDLPRPNASLTLHEVLLQFYKVLKLAGDLWIEKCRESDKITFEEADVEDLKFEQLGVVVLNRLDRMNIHIKEMFDLMKKDSASTLKSEEDLIKPDHCDKPQSPTSVLPEPSKVNPNLKGSQNIAYLPPLLRPLRLQAVGKLEPLGLKQLSFHLFPLVLDHRSKAVTQTENITDELELDSLDATMVLKPISYAEIGSDGHADGSETYEDATLVSTPPAASSLPFDMFESSTPGTLRPTCTGQVSHAVNINRDEDDSSKTSDSTILVPPTLPILRVRATHLSPTPTPPPSPMVLTGIPWFFGSPRQSGMEMEPVAYAMAIDDSDHVCTCEPSETSLFVSPQSSSAASAPKIQTSFSPPLSPVQLNKEPAPSPQLSSSPSLLSKSAPVPPPPSPPRGCVLPASPPPPCASSNQVPSLPSPKGSAPPPPPPQSVAKAINAKKTSTKLKRSTQMGSLYRLLKGKVEGCSLDGKASNGRKSQTGNCSDGKKSQGMADALAEMTKRSAYFRKIEEDVEKHYASIMELRSSINSFETKDMKDLLKFHQHVEQQLENLTDETQVLARFEGFPSKKLETIRMAAALYMKLDSVVTTLKGWSLAAPIAQQLPKVECYFNKIKEAMEVIERNKEEDSKRFRNHKIEFDFTVVVRIKEGMVDLSSDCIEMALEETREMGGETKSKSNGLSTMLWRAFQLAFRVYNFAGGQDDRADRLAKDLAREIETCPRF
ncbi:hypothetical protein C4D60_Mb09t26240 [Musa balbisiana]|uniref:Hydroxyproline-rich glycoprotein family protein n=1 Tax=Musa balbisiana TaxID=52838 RepID=A0A4S8IJ80_MUSBA|nr:hypothetical protein C4D60_Mb09t26240 [Musa balbisiana]